MSEPSTHFPSDYQRGSSEPERPEPAADPAGVTGAGGAPGTFESGSPTPGFWSPGRPSATVNSTGNDAETATEDDAFTEHAPTADEPLTPLTRDDPLGASSELPTTSASTSATSADTPAPSSATAADLAADNWREIQASFVDDPRGSVEAAAALAEREIAAALERLSGYQEELRSQWQNQQDTEALRMAMRSYRAFCAQLAVMTENVI